MSRPIIFACALLAIAALAAQADYFPSSLAYPRWSFSSIEDAWANPRLPKGIKRYPLTSLVDGDPRTAWVFEGPKWDGKQNENGYASVTEHSFQGGLDQTLRIGANQPVLVDAVGIVNGYAKDEETYRRNNRIRSVRITGVHGGREFTLGAKANPLQETMEMQMIRFPAKRVDSVTLFVKKVDRGKDDDLGISELQLFYRGRPLIGKPTPHVLYNTGSECGCGNTLYLLRRSGRLSLGGQPLGEEGFAYGFAGPHLAVARAQETLTVINLITGKQQATLRLPLDAGDLVCPGGLVVRFEDHGKVTDRLDLSRPHPKLERVKQKKPPVH